MSLTLTPVDPAAASRLHRDGALLVDVREPGEYARSRIPMSHNLPLSRLETSALPAGEGQAVIFLCASGNRTTIAAARLAGKAGSAPAYVLAGGLSAWSRAGLPVVQGRAEEPGQRAPARGLLSRWFGL